MHHISIVSPFQYSPGNDSGVVTYLQGLKGGDKPGQYLLVGANNSPGPTPVGLVYQGPLDSVENHGISGSGTWRTVAVPKRFDAAGTSVYGPDNLSGKKVNFVGAYTRDLDGQSPSATEPSIVGFTYTGKVDGSTDRGWRSVQGTTQLGTPGTYTFVHSVDGGLAVGNTDNAEVDDLTRYFSLSSTAFIVDVDSGDQIPIRFPGDRNPFVTHTAYGIWDNGDNTYTIAGGSGEVDPHTSEDSGRVEVGEAYLIDYDSITGEFDNYTSFPYRNGDKGDLVSHFEGIYRTGAGDYQLPATSVALNDKGDETIASVVTVKRNRRGDFKTEALWQDLDITRSSDGTESVLTTGNSLYGDATVGFANYPESDGSLTSLSFVFQDHYDYILGVFQQFL